MKGRHRGADAARAAARTRIGGRRVLPVAAAIGGVAALIGATPGSAAPTNGYELITPVEKHLVDARFVLSGADDGSSVLYDLWGSTSEEDQGFGGRTSFVSHRGTTGWAATSLSPFFVDPLVPASDSIVKSLSADGTSAILFAAGSLTPDDADHGADDSRDLYLLDLKTNRPTLVSRADGTAPDARAGSLTLYGATPDHRTILFTSDQEFVSGAPSGPGRRALYQWQDGKLTLVSQLQDGTPLPAEQFSVADRGAADTNDPNAPRAAHGGAHLVSDDGNVVFFQRGENVNEVYARIGGATTRGISRSQRSSGGAGSVPAGTMGRGNLVGASRDGSIVFFVSSQRLTNSATEGGGLYRYEMATDTLTMVTDAADAGASVNLVAGMVSDDASTVMFSSYAAIGGHGTTGFDANMYSWDATNGTQYIATTPSFTNAHRIARVTRSGRYAVIISTESLAGAANNGFSAVYRYDRETDTIVCASCRPDGSPSEADARLGEPEESSARNVTDDGTVFFTTTEPLVPEDTDTKLDVYGFDGEPFLVSPGASDDVYVGDNSDDGSTVFLRTRSALVPQDVDGGLMDVYAARTGSVFPPPAPPEQPSCVGIECAGPPPAGPTTPAPGSSAVGASGNATPVDPPAQPEPGATKPKVSVKKLGSSAARGLARGRTVKLPVQVTGGGKVTVRLLARVGKKNRSFGSASRTVSQKSATTVNVPVKLSTSGKRRLRSVKRMKITIEVRVGSGAPVRSSLTLKAAR